MFTLTNKPSSTDFTANMAFSGITSQPVYVQRIIETRSHNLCCRGKAINITCFECVSVALLTRHAMRIRRIILSSVACPAVPYFSTLPHKRQDLEKKMVVEYNMPVLILSTTFV
jgi:hypothetical protein